MSSVRSTDGTAAAVFPLVEVRGDARARGRAHGETCRERVRETWAFYIDDLFASAPIGRAAIEARAARIERLTHTLAPAVAAEIEGIAAGSGLAPWQVFVLNARTEILNARVDECTALWFERGRVLAQNWDWVERLEDLVVVVRHEDAQGRRHVTLTEPGMVAKIGMNDAGVGVCLNILFAPHDLSGLPVHILIGSLLGARDFAAARTCLDQAGLGKASHLLVADGSGRALSCEYYGDTRYLLEAEDGVLLHTNHCLGLGAAGRGEDLANSCGRYDVARARVATAPGRDLAAAARVLLDPAGGDDALLRPYRDSELFPGHRIGTCASVFMELAERRLHVRRGPAPDAAATTVAL